MHRQPTHTAPLVGWAAPCRRYVLRRRLRVTTVSLGVATSPVQLYTSCDAAATALVLMHKVLGAAAAEGSLTAARALLREWLAALAASAAAVLASENEELMGAGAGRGRGAGAAAAQEGGAGEEVEEVLQVRAGPWQYHRVCIEARAVGELFSSWRFPVLRAIQQFIWLV
jgi:hypothetical protein